MLACAAIKMAVAPRGGRQTIWRDEESKRVIYHTDYAEVCVKPRICGDGLRSWWMLADFSA